ncbi:MULTISPECIES: FimV/HubP family polar landmark protein [unclassified Methylophaga]|uniref:FimV/HubP family polar landmark protein n=1 Tax=unclassified Methylophaga TaxID=2629249 RepID=UPI000C8FCB69|nr:MULTISPECIES: FimV/HubP family polar landmark protein [unclassified Methylophaga]MBN47866.1 hypothetical protein [Methylophaga sp.]|tara:strand:+ start:31680 stop:34541 length:2862 start_codon:yes stop_codon:yes gene_type:complete
MKQKTLASLSVATALGLLTPLTGYAFGLGQITLHSALNEPFRAEISVNALREDERGNLQVRLASTQDFERAGLDRSFLLTQLNFEVVEEANSTRIMITSDVPIKEPFLGFLLAATTGQGKLLREYTVLLDPPKELYRNQASRAPSGSSISQRSQPTPVASRQEPTAWTASRDNVSEYKVHSRDTLWSIAERTRPSANITMQQMMLALLNANPRAFQQNNVNSLYAGSTLRIPSTDEITRISASEAKQTVDQQNATWRNRSQAVTPVPTANEVAPSISVNEEASPEIDAEADDNAVANPDDESASLQADEEDAAAESARLKLIAATENSLLDADPEINGDPDLQKISEQLTLAQETIEAQSQENIDFKNRMDAMERQLDTMRRLISLKDADMARLQSLLEQDESQMDLATLVDEANAILEGSEADNIANLNTLSEDATPKSDDDNDWQPVEINNGESVSGISGEGEALPELNEDSFGVIAETDEDNAAEQMDTQLDESTADSTELETASAEVDVAIDEAAQMLDLDQQQMDSLYQRVQAFVIAHKVESLLAVLLLLLILWMILRRSQREVSWDDAVSKIQKNKPVKADPEAGTVNIVAPSVDEINTSAESKTKTVEELVEQAEMFVGYADYVQAGTALEQAHHQAPDDNDIAAKLMFVYYKQQKSADFIALLNTTGIDETHPQWPEIRSWGNQLLPHNPLFAEQSEAMDEETHHAEESTVQEEARVNIEEDSATEQPQPLDSSAETEESDHIDFNLDDYTTDSAPSSQGDEVYQRDEEDLLPFDLNEVAEKDREIETEEPDVQFAEDDNDLRIDLDQDNVLQPDSSAPDILDLAIDESEEDAEQVASDESEEVISLDSDELDLSAFEIEDEPATETDDVIEDYLNLDSSLDDEELDFDLSDFDSIDEAETKLDLAEAYKDMGDPEGARGILEEVLEQGTDEQKKRAQELLDSLI